MYCQKCGTRLDEGMRFCPSCGAQCPPARPQNAYAGASNAPAQGNSGAAYPGYASPAKPARKKSLAIPIIIMLVICLLLAGACALVIPGAVNAARKGREPSLPWSHAEGTPTLDELESEARAGTPDYLILPEDERQNPYAPEETGRSHASYEWFEDTRNSWENAEEEAS